MAATGLPCHACGMTFRECMDLIPLWEAGDRVCCEDCDHSPKESTDKASTPTTEDKP